ncbi:MFS transporter [Seohaeicola nanhaiensis]|uniref:MFS transporter n=1 Tax=Seohaeicola nanhaiensis TaxID=1387282 RepID=A0ABV9KMI0_9RHOB
MQDIDPEETRTVSSVRLLVGISFISYVGTWTERVALGWLAWTLTQSTFWTGFVSMSVLLPSAFLGPIVAVYAEGWDSRRAMMLTNGAFMVTSLLLFALVAGGFITLPLLAVLALAIGVIGAAMHPVRLTLIPSVSPRHYLPRAVALSAMAFNASRVVGPAVAGLLITTVGLNWTFLVNALSYLPYIALLALIPMKPRPARGVKSSLGQGLAEGLRYALAHPLIRWSLLLAATNSLLVRSIVENMPAVVGGLLDGNARDLTWMTSAAGLGSVTAAITLGWLKRDTRQLQTMLRLVPLVSAALCLALSAGLPFAGLVAIAVGLGFVATFVGIGSQIIIQMEVADTHRARVLTWWSSASFAAVSLGGLATGAVGDLAGMGFAIFLLGLLGAVLATGFALRR